MRSHKIKGLALQAPNEATREININYDVKKYKYTVFDTPSFLLHISNWIIHKNGTGAKGKILMIMSVIINILGMALQLSFVCGLYTNKTYTIISVPIIQYIHFSSLYITVFAFIFLWKSWKRNAVQKFNSSLQMLRKNLNIPLSSKLWLVMCMVLSVVAMGIRIYTTLDTYVMENMKTFAIHFISENDIRSTL